MKPFKNKFAWSYFANIAILPLAILFEIIFFGLVLTILFKVPYWIFGGLAVAVFCSAVYIYSVAKISTGKQKKTSLK